MSDGPSILAAVTAQGLKIRELKSGGADKAALTPEVHLIQSLCFSHMLCFQPRGVEAALDTATQLQPTEMGLFRLVSLGTLFCSY